MGVRDRLKSCWSMLVISSLTAMCADERSWLSIGSALSVTIMIVGNGITIQFQIPNELCGNSLEKGMNPSFMFLLQWQPVWNIKNFKFKLELFKLKIDFIFHLSCPG